MRKIKHTKPFKNTRGVSKVFTVTGGEINLLDFLIASLTSESRNNIKAFLSRKQILVNDVPISQFDYKLVSKDVVKVTPYSNRSVNNVKGVKLKVIYEDDELLVINKPSGLISVASEKESNITAYRLVSDYVSTADKNARIYVVHRLDENTSGVLLFAKNNALKLALQDDWNKLVKKRGYFGVVEGVIEKESDTIKSYLLQTKTNMVYSGHKSKDAKYAETAYKVIKHNDFYTLLDINISTGRKNQIRVHMRDIGHPVVGDNKYGEEEKPLSRLMLHSYELTLTHPLNGKLLSFKANPPSEFAQLVKENGTKLVKKEVRSKQIEVSNNKKIKINDKRSVKRRGK